MYGYKISSVIDKNNKMPWDGALISEYSLSNGSHVLAWTWHLREQYTVKLFTKTGNFSCVLTILIKYCGRGRETETITSVHLFEATHFFLTVSQE